MFNKSVQIAVTALLFAVPSVASAAGTMLIHHKVASYATWRPQFDADEARRNTAGLTKPRVMQSADNPNNLVLLFDMADIAKAKVFASADTTKQIMGKAGVQGAPEILFLDTAPK
ncbi:MAG: hypothetical protein RL274_1859 [Pseudomonadota bacterium]|jgi:hypothetical protein